MSFRTIAATRQKEINASMALEATRTRAAGLGVEAVARLERSASRIPLLFDHETHKETVKEISKYE